MLSITLPLLMFSPVHGCEYHICSSEYAELVSSQQLLNGQRESLLDARDQNHDVHDQNHEGHSPSTDVHKSDPTVPTKEQVEYCNLLNAYNQCMKTQSKSCRGNMNYHAITAMVRKWLKDQNCSIHKSQRGNVRSQVSSIGTIRKELESRKKEELLIKKLEICFSDAINYTIDPVGFINRYHGQQFNKFGSQLNAGQFNSGQFLKSDFKVIDDTDNPDSLLNDGPTVPMSVMDNLPLIPPTVPSHLSRGRSQRSQDPGVRSLPTLSSSENYDDANTDASEDANEEKDADEKEGLLCLLYGDPHLRTIKNDFMTCRCLGAWPLIDHPLFAVQVTNSKDNANHGRSQISGVTKVTVLVRRFASCGIKHDLMYEADVSSSSDGSNHENPENQNLNNENLNYENSENMKNLNSENLKNGNLDFNRSEFIPLPVSFIDGSINTPNNMVRIMKTVSDNGHHGNGGHDDEVCIEMRHINVHVCINQFIGRSLSASGKSSLGVRSASGQIFDHGHSLNGRHSGQSNYLNVQIKFNPMSKSDNDAITASISESSLCKSGCPLRERIDIESILDAAGFNILDTFHFDKDANTDADNNFAANMSIPISEVKECHGLYGY